MDRQALLDRLHQVHFAAFLTALTSEMCIELQTINSEGISCSWMTDDDWNVYELRSCSQEKWDEIRNKINKDELTRSDLEGTDFGAVLGSVENVRGEVDCSVLLKDLLREEFEKPIISYCCYDYSSNALNLFPTEEDLKIFLKNYYPCDCSWEELDTDELKYWFELYEKEGQNVPCFSFKDDE